MPVSSDLVEMLRALLRGDFDGVDATVQEVERRDGWNTLAVLIASAFLLAVNRKFTPDQDVREITAYVRKVSAQYNTDQEYAVPPMVGEAAIRAVLGEEHLLGGIDPETGVSAQMILLYAIMSEEELTDQERETFVAEAVQTAEQSLAE